MSMSNLGSFKSFVVQGNEFESLVRNIWKIECNNLCFYADREKPEKAALSKETVELMEDDVFEKAVRLLAQPTLRLSAVKGGSTFNPEALNVSLMKKDGEVKATVLIPLKDNSVLAYFENLESFVEWWADMFAAKTQNPVKNLLKAKLPLEEFLMTLHGIDSFRRSYMQSMLSYQIPEKYTLEVAELIAAFNVSSRNRDHRWLMPAFLALTPDLGKLSVDIDENLIYTMADLEIFEGCGKLPNGEEAFRFLNTGITLGLEFATSWLHSVGYSAARLAADGSVQTLGSRFLAPTALTNHVFTAEPTGEGELSFGHENYPYGGYGDAFSNWIAELLK